jgi:glutaredoxin
MTDKIQLEHSESTPQCPHCKAALTRMNWHKVKGGPSMVTYIAIMSCPHCRRVLGAVGQ